MLDRNKPFDAIVDHTDTVAHQKGNAHDDALAVARIQHLGVVDVVHVVGKAQRERVAEVIF